MDEVITRIISIEKECAAAIDQAEKESARHIEEHRRNCEARKEEERRQILSSEKARLTQTLNDANQKIQDETAIFLQESEQRFADPQLHMQIKNAITDLLLEA